MIGQTMAYNTMGRERLDSRNKGAGAKEVMNHAMERKCLGKRNKGPCVIDLDSCNGNEITL